MNWLAYDADGNETPAGPGIPIDRDSLVAISCDGYRVAVWPDADFTRFERTSVGKHTWTVGIIAVDNHVYIVWPGGEPVQHQLGWGTDVLTGPPRSAHADR